MLKTYIIGLMFSSHIFRANDIRGRYPQDFDLSFTKDLAYALCLLARQKKIPQPQFLLGQDTRLSSPEIGRALVRHLKNQGAGVAVIGLAPSPLCYFLLQHYNLSACIVITASHNPSTHNGFKILFHKKYHCLKPIQDLKTILQKKKIPAQKILKSKGFLFKVEKEKPYITSLKKEFPQLKNFPFAVDTGNGALGPLAKKVFSALGLKPKYLFNAPDGHFPHHHPDPTVEKNLQDLKNTIQKEGLKLGFGFDGDGDRLILVNQKRQSILGDEFGSLFLKTLVKNQRRKTPALILADVKCSDWFFDFANQLGLKVLMTKSGHGLIRTQMEKRRALFAVEFSGHIFFNDRKNRGFDDALYASLRLLELLSSATLGLADLRPKDSTVRTGEIRQDMTLSEISKKLSKIQSYLTCRGENFKTIDGIRLSRGKSWALFRSSKTQEALTMRFEAPSHPELQQLKEEFSKVMALKIP